MAYTIDDLVTPHRNSLIYPVFQLALKSMPPMLRIFNYRISVEGKEAAEEALQNGALLAAKHSNNWDSFVLGSVLRNIPYIVVDHDLFHDTRSLGKLVSQLGAIGIDNLGPNQKLKSLDRTLILEAEKSIKYQLRQGFSIGFYPEGMKSYSVEHCNPRLFRPAIELYQEEGIDTPVITAVVNYHHLPYAPGGRASVQFGKPMAASDFSNSTSRRGAIDLAKVVEDQFRDDYHTTAPRARVRGKTRLPGIRDVLYKL